MRSSVLWLSAAIIGVATAAVGQSSTGALPTAWTGPYLGGSAGYGMGRSNVILTPTGAFVGDPDQGFNGANGSRQLNAIGFVGGGYGGYNIQVLPGSGLVASLEGTASYIGYSRAFATGTLTNGTHAGPNVASFSARVNADDLFSLRGRLGVSVDGFLFYALGGMAITTARYSEAVLYPTTNATPAAAAAAFAAPALVAAAPPAAVLAGPIASGGSITLSGSTATFAAATASTVTIVNAPVPVGSAAQPLSGQNTGFKAVTLVGLTVGAGAEYALSPNWTVRTEFSHADLGKIRFGTSNPDFPAFTTRNQADIVVNTVTFGLSYRY